MLEIERMWDKLTLSHQTTLHGNISTLELISGNVTSLILPSGGVTKVKFWSDVMREFAGFDLDFYSFSHNETIGGAVLDDFMCLSGLQTIKAIARCDHVIDCHDFSDEVGCGNCSADSYVCRGSDICLEADYQCDGVYDCPLSDDEENCAFTYNLITEVNATLFTGIEETLLLLSIEGNPLEHVAPGSFKNLVALRNLYAFDPRICCVAPEKAVCTLRLPAHPLFTCRLTFLQDLPTKIFIWILGISALIGNSYVIIQRLLAKFSRDTAKVQSILILNLAISDFLMGIYLLILATMDIVISDSYFWEGRAEEWRTSSICQAAGFISVLSSETSVFLITIISFDRVIAVLFPFSQRRLSVKSAHVVVGSTWGLALLLSIFAAVLNYLNPDAYGLSDVCVGLPLIRKNSGLKSVVDENTFTEIGFVLHKTIAAASESTWQFSIVLFLGVNFFCFSVVLIAYIIIFIWVRVTRNNAGRKDSEGAEIKMAAKMSLLVGTDFFCWMPIIILGILVQSNIVTLSSDVYAWLVVFVLPINSSINPYLYTIVDATTHKQKLKGKKQAEAAVTVKAFGMFRASLPQTYPSGTHRTSGESGQLKQQKMSSLIRRSVASLQVSERSPRRVLHRIFVSAQLRRILFVKPLFCLRVQSFNLVFYDSD
ncbi:relaxin receptor 2-like [Diadema setosum]|uniref:relaxin receptor 2-like n=1 Tax=Diadema setosum TaxID=31175 RepID=UPI003B3A0821